MSDHETTMGTVTLHTVECSCGWRHFPGQDFGGHESSRLAPERATLDKYSRDRAERQFAQHCNDHTIKSRKRRALKDRHQAGTVERQACRAVVTSWIEGRQVQWRDSFPPVRYRIGCACGYATREYPATDQSGFTDYQQHKDRGRDD